MEKLMPGMIVKHFKHDSLSEENKKKYKHIYRIIATDAMVQCSSGEVPEKDGEGNPILMCVYMQFTEPYMTFARPMHEMYDKVDKKKYPDAKQEYRMERIKIGGEE